MTRVCIKIIKTVENIFLGAGENAPEIRSHLLFSNKKSDILGGVYCRVNEAFYSGGEAWGRANFWS